MSMESLKQALEFAVFNTHSDFYRKKYGTTHAELLEGSLERFPFLTRIEIDEAPVFERTFVPNKMVRFIRTTSGSTGRGVVGFPMLEEPELEAHRRSLGFPKPLDRVRYFEPYMNDFAIRSILMFSAGAFVHEPRLRIEEGRHFIAGEYAEPKLTAQLACEAKVDCIVANPSGLVVFAPYLQTLGHVQKVRLIISVGERPTETQLQMLKTFFPNAHVALQYGLTETQGLVGYTCPQRLSVDPKALHKASGSILLELIDPDTEVSLPLVPGTEGEVVVTTLEPLAFPLIRYRTGDFARIREETCDCKGSPVLFECLGRLTLDRIRVPRGVLTIAAIDQAVSALPFEVKEFTAKWNTDEVVPGLEITLYIEEGTETDTITPEALAKLVLIAPNTSYFDITEAKLAPKLVLTLKPAESSIGWNKKKRLA